MAVTQNSIHLDIDSAKPATVRELELERIGSYLEISQHLRYNYFIRDKIEYEVFGQAQFNTKLRIVFRGLLGTGLRFHILEIENGKIFFGLSYMYEYDELNIVPESISYFRDHRMSSYLSLSANIKDNISISNTTYYQPVLKKFSDVRLSSQTNLNFIISKRFSLTTSISITNDTRVPEEVPAAVLVWICHTAPTSCLSVTTNGYRAWNWEVFPFRVVQMEAMVDIPISPWKEPGEIPWI